MSSASAQNLNERSLKLTWNAWTLHKVSRSRITNSVTSLSTQSFNHLIKKLKREKEKASERERERGRARDRESNDFITEHATWTLNYQIQLPTKNTPKPHLSQSLCSSETQMVTLQFPDAVKLWLVVWHEGGWVVVCVLLLVDHFCFLHGIRAVTLCRLHHFAHVLQLFLQQLAPCLRRWQLGLQLWRGFKSEVSLFTVHAR